MMDSPDQCVTACLGSKCHASTASHKGELPKCNIWKGQECRSPMKSRYSSGAANCIALSHSDEEALTSASNAIACQGLGPYTQSC